jgi:hypothetical protein
MSKVSDPPAGRRIMGWSLLVVFWLAATAAARAQTPAQPNAAEAAESSDLPTVTYRRVFEGSTPEFIEIVLRQDGSAKADVRQLSDPPSPEDFMVSAAFGGEIFDLVRELHNFQDAKLDSGRRVAYTGKKTLRWQKGAESYQAEYNYTLNAKASRLQKMFEDLAQEQMDLDTLEQRLRYDRLGVNEALDRFEGHLNRGDLPEPQRFLMVLDRIAGDSRLIGVARQRARSLAARIRVGQSQEP